MRELSSSNKGNLREIWKSFPAVLKPQLNFSVLDRTSARDPGGSDRLRKAVREIKPRQRIGPVSNGQPNALGVETVHWDFERLHGSHPHAAGETRDMRKGYRNGATYTQQ